MLSFVKGGIIKVWTYKISRRYAGNAQTGLPKARISSAGSVLSVDTKIKPVELPSERPIKGGKMRFGISGMMVFVALASYALKNFAQGGLLPPHMGGYAQRPLQPPRLHVRKASKKQRGKGR